MLLSGQSPTPRSSPVISSWCSTKNQNSDERLEQSTKRIATGSGDGGQPCEPFHKDEAFLLSQRDPGSDLRNIIMKKLSAPGDAPTIETWDVSNVNVLAMLEAGLHVSGHCESWTTFAYPGVRFREVRDASGPSHITFTACWDRNNENPALARFLAFLRKTHHPTLLT